MSEKNLSASGGGEAGRAYAGVQKEVIEKNIRFNIVSLSSAAAVMFPPLLSGMNIDQIKNLLLSLKGDKYLNYDQEIKTAKWYKKIPMLIAWIVVLRTKFYKSAKKIAQKYFSSWDSVLVRCKKMYISFVDLNDVKKVLKKDLRGGLFGNQSFKLDMTAKQLLKDIPVYYASDDGIYQYYTGVFKSIVKVSDQVIPLWQAILMAFNNPIFPKIKIKINGKTIRATDGGLADNFAVGPQNKNDFISLACISHEGDNDIELLDMSYELLKEKEPTKFVEVQVKKHYGNFNFSDIALIEEFERPATNIF